MSDETPAVDTTAAPVDVVEEQKPVVAPTEPVAAPSEPVAAPTEPATLPVTEKATPAPATTPLAKLFQELPSIIKEANHDEMWGVVLKDESDVPTTIVLEKFLRANTKDVSKAKAQLIEALKWRKRMDTLKLLDTEYETAKFGDLGYVTAYQLPEGKGKEIITWNIYGAVKDIKATFGDVQEFIRWRSAIMELSVKELDLASATARIPEDGPDPYRMVQVHDYLNVSFLRMDPTIRAATKETIQTFSMAYPELLKEKFFVNVPLVMGWVFAAIKIFLSPETVKKFHPLSYGGSLAGELKDVGPLLPEAYGGKGEDLKSSGVTVKYASTETVEAEEAVKAEPAAQTA